MSRLIVQVSLHTICSWNTPLDIFSRSLTLYKPTLRARAQSVCVYRCMYAQVCARVKCVCVCSRVRSVCGVYTCEVCGVCTCGVVVVCVYFLSHNGGTEHMNKRHNTLWYCFFTFISLRTAGQCSSCWETLVMWCLKCLKFCTSLLALNQFTLLSSYHGLTHLEWAYE